MFLRSVLVGLEQLIFKKIAPRSLSFINTIQIASDIDFIRLWAIHAEETFHSLIDVQKREEEEGEDEKDGLVELQEEVEDEEEEGGEGEKRDDSFSKKSGSFSGYRISNMQSIHESFKNKNNTNNNNNNNKKNKNALPAVEEIPTPFSKGKDFERWEKIIEILTSFTTNERMVTREELENSPIPDANNWINLCKKRDKN